MAAKREKQPKPQDERHYRAVAAAHVGVAKRGPKALADNLNRGRAARFEKQVDEMFPGLRQRDPNDFAARVQALNKAHMARCTAASTANRKRRSESCPWCREERGDYRGDLLPRDLSEQVCPKHEKEWDKKFALMMRVRGVSAERAKEILHLAQQAYRQSA